MRTPILITVVFLLSLCAYQPSEGAEGWYASDGVWDVVYFGGSGLVTITLNNMCEWGYFKSYATTFAAGFTKEFLDAMYADGVFGKPKSNHPILDARGADTGDLLLTLASVIISYPNRRKECQVTVMASRRHLRLSVLLRLS